MGEARGQNRDPINQCARSESCSVSASQVDSMPANQFFRPGNRKQATLSGLQRLEPTLDDFPVMLAAAQPDEPAGVGIVTARGQSRGPCRVPGTVPRSRGVDGGKAYCHGTCVPCFGFPIWRAAPAE